METVITCVALLGIIAVEGGMIALPRSHRMWWVLGLAGGCVLLNVIGGFLRAPIGLVGARIVAGAVSAMIYASAAYAIGIVVRWIGEAINRSATPPSPK